ncbi:hypothetical protein HAZT_HAZT005571 [Hyalella azteca]|uniref:Adenosine 3'-phospho 5'-phosphosulfate transporter 2 n=1 Tax=Hyalella azteca TaxID=294128 RepID=A0A6A0GUP0_HYAAZ|nr:hypothetical protein HAZT_HAZT005571 [Hyalella azteca]
MLCMEFVFRVEGLRDHGWFVTLIQFGYYSLFAVMQLAVSRQSVRTNVPLNTYFTIALITVGTMGFSNTSMGYLNYPTQVIFKSCKLIPVMIGSIIILRKTYSFAQVLSCLMMCAGLVWFTLADSQIQPDFNLQGVVLVSMSLCCDAIIGNVQEAALKNSHEPSARVVLYSYGLGFLCILAFLLLTGSLLPGAFFFLEALICYSLPLYLFVVALVLYYSYGVRILFNLAFHHWYPFDRSNLLPRGTYLLLSPLVLFFVPLVLYYSYGIRILFNLAFRHLHSIARKSILVLSASGFCGVQAVLALVTLHGALVAVTVTTARKAISILLSFLLFTKPFTIQ